MNISTTSAPARTDARSHVHVTRPANRDAAEETTVRRLALGLTAGAVTWSAASYLYGFNPGSEAGVKVTDLTGLAFQVGVMSLLHLQMRTRATGLGRAANGMLKAERVVLALAMVWSLVHALVPGARGTVWLGILDAMWPLSMLGMFVIGVKIAFAGRWRGAARLYPLVAESWAVVSVPAMGILGASAGSIVGATHLLVGYATLGVIIAARPHQVTALD